MKYYRILLVLTVLVAASLACNALAGGKDDLAAPESSGNQVEQGTDAPAPANSGDSSNSVTTNTDFPITADAYNSIEIGDGSLLYYTKMSQDDVLKFYRDEYASRGYTERELLTTISDGVFSIVFDGDPSGKDVVVQSVDLGDGSRTVAIRLE